jgi:hypothetical protein
MNKGFFGRNIADKVHEIQASTLREIELDDALRKDILNAPYATGASGISSHKADGTLNINAPTVAGDFPITVWNRIDKRLSEYSYLICRAKICELALVCGLDDYPDKNVYVQSVAISASIGSSTTLRQLKLFCWEK